MANLGFCSCVGDFFLRKKILKKNNDIWAQVAAPTSTAAAAVFAPQAAAWERERERLLHVVGRLQSEVRELRAERTANYNHEGLFDMYAFFYSYMHMLFSTHTCIF